MPKARFNRTFQFGGWAGTASREYPATPQKSFRWFW